MFVLTSDITIGDFVSVKPYEVHVAKSVKSFLNTARIKIPIRALFIDKFNYPGTIVKTSEVFKEGMPVKIKVGYNGNNNTEFEGFVARVNFTSPLELVCEGYSYQLRKRTYFKTFKNTTLIEVLKYLLQDTDIILDKNVDDVPIMKLVILHNSGIEVLRKLTEILHSSISFRFAGNVLIAEYFPIKQERGIVDYTIGWNVVRSDDLTKREAKNEDVEIHLISQSNDGSTVNVSKGNVRYKPNGNVGLSGVKGEVKFFKTHYIKDEQSLNKIANAIHAKLTFDGYEGKITTFLEPYCEPGYKAIIEDVSYPERNGHYLVESVEVSYGMHGGRRSVGVGMQLQ